MGQGNLTHTYRLGGEWIQTSPGVKDLERCLQKKAEYHSGLHACIPEVQLYPGLHQKSMSSRSRQVILPLYSENLPGLVKKKDMVLLEGAREEPLS